ncbi:MAG: IPT/TIG domain-containing protein [Acidobacteriota bacterium]|nr:IPT/TIG domain-containing protein [Acidobacteriota bacterium]
MGTNFASAGQISISPAPSVIAVAPSKGPLAGGQSVVVTGADFEKGDTVRFGTRAATIRSISASGQSMTVDAPPGNPGSPVDVTVTAPWGGTSMISSGDQYSYLAVPTVAAIVPTHGSVDGGTPLQIQGTGLTSDSTVTVGGKPTPVVNAGADGTWLQVVTPTGPAGPAPIVVTNPGGTSATGPASTFTYDGPAVSTTTAASTTTVASTTTDPATTTTTRPNPTTTAPPSSSTTSSTLWVPPVPPSDPSTSTTTAPGWIGNTSAGLGSSSGLGTSVGGSTFYDPSGSYGGYGYTNGVGPGLSFTGGSTTLTTLGSDPQIVPADASSPTTAVTQGIQPAAIIGTSGHSLLTTILAIVALGELLVMLFLWKLGKNLALTRSSSSPPDGQGE